MGLELSGQPTALECGQTARGLTAQLPAPELDLRGHITALDGIRGTAILLVMLHHLIRLPASLEEGSAAKELLSAGAWGVDLFFVLSGFLITGILYDAKERPHYFRNFYARRVLRIFPLYYGYLVL